MKPNSLVKHTHTHMLCFIVLLSVTVCVFFVKDSCFACGVFCRFLKVFPQPVCVLKALGYIPGSYLKKVHTFKHNIIKITLFFFSLTVRDLVCVLETVTV